MDLGGIGKLSTQTGKQLLKKWLPLATEVAPKLNGIIFMSNTLDSQKEEAVVMEE